MNIEKKVYTVLRKLGARPELKGYHYIKYAMQLLIQNDGMIPATKELYPAVAERFKTSATRVERSIRHCVQDICDHTPIDTLIDILGESHINSGELRYTNSNFLSLLYEYLKYECSEETEPTPEEQNCPQEETSNKEGHWKWKNS